MSTADTHKRAVYVALCRENAEKALVNVASALKHMREAGGGHNAACELERATTAISNAIRLADQHRRQMLRRAERRSLKASNA